ncbi:hypothetical protein EAE96_002600 [Botrytis aclada]|nr:hypothetical protein EAE96_002600 [Botrytis aclada]
MKSKKIKYTYSRRSLRPNLAQNKGVCGAEFPLDDPSPSDFQHKQTIAIDMMDVPVTRTSSGTEASSRPTLHALTPPPFDYTQYTESSFDESSHAGYELENIEDTFNAPYGIYAQGNWCGTFPNPGAHTDEYMGRAENQFKESIYSDGQHDESREKRLSHIHSNHLDQRHAPTQGNHDSQNMVTTETPSDESKRFDAQDDYSVLPPPTPPNMRPDFSQWNSNIETANTERDTPQNMYRLSDTKGCEKIEKDCQAGNLPGNVISRAKHLWKMLSQAAVDFHCLRFDETMDKVPEILVACCIYIACQQCNIPRTFIAIRVLTETSSLEFQCSGAYHMSCVKSLNATIATANASGFICRRCVPCITHPDVEQNPGKPTEKPLPAARDSLRVKSNNGEKMEKTFKLREDRSQASESVREELKANSIDNKMIKWLMNRCRNLQERQDEDIAKVLAPVQRNFLAQIKDAEDATIKLLKESHEAPRIKLSKAQEVYIAALQTDFLQFNLQSGLQSFLARLQQTNNNPSTLKRNRNILEPSDEVCKEFKAALVGCRSETATERSAEYADSSSQSIKGDFPQHRQVTSTIPYRGSARRKVNSESEEGEIREHPEPKFRKSKPVMRPGQQRQAKRARVITQEQMTQSVSQTAATRQPLKQKPA